MIGDFLQLVSSFAGVADHDNPVSQKCIVTVQLREVAVRQGEASPEKAPMFVENMLLPSSGEFDDEPILQM